LHFILKREVNAMLLIRSKQFIQLKLMDLTELSERALSTSSQIGMLLKVPSSSLRPFKLLGLVRSRRAGILFEAQCTQGQ
jgi:hypothetical protein